MRIVRFSQSTKYMLPVFCVAAAWISWGTGPVSAQSWYEETTLSVGNTTNFGFAVAVAGDIAVVGATGGTGTPGSAYVFQHNSGWGQIGELISNDYDPLVNVRFGASVSLAGDLALVGAPLASAAYLFQQDENDPGTWQQSYKFEGVNGFGESVALDGNMALISAGSLGEAHLYRDGGGGAWQHVATLAADEQLPGLSVALDGDTAVVGAPFEASSVGAAYVFRDEGEDTWVRTKLTASNDLAGDFGVSVAVQDDTLFVGAPFTGDPFSTPLGAAYVFQEQADGTWSELTELTVDGTGFGASVAVQGDRAVIGAMSDDGAADGTGSAYVFARDAGGTWSQAQKLFAEGGITDDNFGNAVALDGDTIVLGAFSREGQGAAYVFTDLTADFKVDGTVNGSDLDTWKNGYGTSPAANREDGDANGDGVVDGIDFLMWQLQYGKSINVVAAASATAVPEPRAVQLLAVLLAVALGFRPMLR